MDAKQLKLCAQALKEAVGLTELDFSSNKLGWAGVESLSKALCECPKLQALETHARITCLCDCYVIAM